MCIANENEPGGGGYYGDGGGMVGDVVVATADFSPGPLAFAGIDWAALTAGDFATPLPTVPNGLIHVEVDASDLEALGELWRLYGSASYLPSY